VGWPAEALDPLVTPRSGRRTVTVLAIALVLVIGILGARLANSDQGNGLLALQVIPIALVALELGLLPGLACAVVALGTVGIWDVSRSVDIAPYEYLARVAVYFPVAVAVGWAAGRIRAGEETIASREERMRSIVESSSDALVTMDEDGRILAWNPVAERMFGWSADDVIGKDLAEVTMPPRIGELYREGKRRFLEEGDWSMIGRRFESRALTRDGREFPIEIAISAVTESDHWIFHVFGHDITERKAFQEERKRLVNIIGSTDDAILSFTLEGRITSWNPGAGRIYGYSEGEALEMSLFDFVPPDRPDDVGPLLERVRRGGRIESVEVDRVGKGGVNVEVSVTVTPIANPSGEVVAGAAIHRDVSDRRRRERYLTAQHGATRLLAQAPELESVGPAIMPLLAGAGSWLCAAYWSCTEDGLQCDGVWTAPTTRLPVNPVLESAESEEHPSHMELQWITPGTGENRLPNGERASLGGLRTQLWLPIVVSGELFGAFEFFDRRDRQRDDELIDSLEAISDQIGNYVRRRRAEEEVERAKDEFFGLVSHELRTPLTSIIGYGEILSESEADRLTEQGR
jgi:PAS domain S-box-containing protein